MSRLNKPALMNSLPYALVFFTPLLLFLIPLLGGQVLFWGTPSLQFIPWRAYGYALLEQGILPFWNPLNGLGAPLFANYQSAFLYPPSFILYVFYRLGEVPGLAVGSTLLIPLHLGWAGVGTMLLLRQLGVGLRGQVVAGLSFGMCAFLVTRSMFFSMIWTGVWLPWLVWAADRVVTATQTRVRLRHGILLAGVFAFQLLAGHAQLTWYAAVLASAWAAVRLIGKVRLSTVVCRLSVYAAGMCMAALIALPQLLPTFEYLQQSQRSSAVDFDFAMTYSLWPWRLTGFLLPDLFGNPGNGTYWGYGAYWEDAVYIGVVPFLLAASTLLWILKRRVLGDDDLPKRLIVFLWVVLLFSVVLALGKNTPVFPWLYGNIPTFDMFQAPSRYLFWTTFALVLLAGVAADRWKRPTGKSRKNYVRLMVVSLAMLLGCAAASILLPQIEPSFIRAFLILAVLLFCAAGLALKTPLESNPRVLSKRWWIGGVMVLMILDVCLADATANPTIAADFYRTSAREYPIPSTRTFIASRDEYAIKFKRYLSMQDFNSFSNWQEMRDVTLPNLNLLENVAMINNFDPLVPGWYAQWMEWIEGLPAAEQRTILAGLAVDSIVRVDEEKGNDWWVERVQAEDRITWKACEVRVESLQDALQAKVLQSGGRNSFPTCIIVESGHSCTDGAPSATPQIELVTDRADLMVIDVKADTPGWMRIADSWYPGWKAELDGKVVDIIRADALVKGVCVPAGEHRLTLSYLPTNIVPAAWISLASILMCIAAAIVLQKK